MKEQLEQLKRKFHEIFQTDQAELDFGIYRLMRAKREEFDRYLEGPLLTDLRQSFGVAAVKHNESLEESVLSDLVQFLGRYYKEGDFLSLPRYRKNSYSIEYNGEEVKLHWANADQYYVKTAERFRDYRF